MKALIYVLLGLLGLLVMIVMVVIVGGSMIARYHEASVEVDLDHSPQSVWAMISDIPASAQWRNGVASIQRIDDREGEPCFEEHNDFGEIRYCVEQALAPTRLVTRIVDNTEFGGRWVYEIAPREGGATLRITEQGEIHNKMFRFLSRFVFGYDATLRGYVAALQKAEIREVTSPEISSALSPDPS